METIITVKIYYILVSDGFRFDPEMLSSARREKLTKISNPAAQKLSAATDRALHAALRDNVPGYTPPPALSYAPDGRPQVPGAYISIAHTKGLAACAIAGAPVGLDVEPEDRDVRQIRGKLLSESEKGVGLEHDPERLLNLWVAKEAYLKLTGEGLAGGMHNYTTEDETIRDSRGEFRAHLRYQPLPGYRIAVCCYEPFAIELIPAT